MLRSDVPGCSLVEDPCPALVPWLVSVPIVDSMVLVVVNSSGVDVVASVVEAVAAVVEVVGSTGAVGVTNIYIHNS